MSTTAERSAFSQPEKWAEDNACHLEEGRLEEGRLEEGACLLAASRSSDQPLEGVVTLLPWVTQEAGQVTRPKGSGGVYESDTPSLVG